MCAYIIPCCASKVFADYCRLRQCNLKHSPVSTALLYTSCKRAVFNIEESGTKQTDELSPPM